MVRIKIFQQTNRKNIVLSDGSSLPLENCLELHTANTQHVPAGVNTGNEPSLVLLEVEVVMPGGRHHPVVIAEVPTDASCIERTLRHQDLKTIN